MAGSPPGTKYLADSNTFKGATDQIATLGSDLDITEGNVDTLETQVSNIITDITNIKNSLTSLNSTVGSQGAALNSVNGLITTAINAEVSSRNSAIVTAVGAEASRIDLVLTSYETTGSVNAKFTAEVSSRNTAISNALLAEATRVDSVLANYETKSGVTTKISAESTDRTTAIANAMSAEVTRVSTLLAGYTKTTDVDLKVSAEVTSRNTAIASAVGAEAQRIDEILTHYTTTEGINAKFTTEASTRTTAISNALGAEVERVDLLLADYDTSGAVDTKITAEATNRTNAIATAMGAEVSRVDELLSSFSVSGGTATGGGNWLSNTDFVTLDGWSITNKPAGSDWGINLAGNGWHPVGENVLSASQTGSGGTYVELASDPFPVVPSSFLQFYVFAASHRTYTYVTLFFYDYNGDVITYAGDTSSTIVDNGGTDPRTYERIGKKYFQVPENAISAKMYLRKQDTLVGKADSYAWFWRPYVGPSADQQSIWNPFVSGTSKATQVQTLAKIQNEATTRANSQGALVSTINTLSAGYKATSLVVANQFPRSFNDLKNWSMSTSGYPENLLGSLTYESYFVNNIPAIRMPVGAASLATVGVAPYKIGRLIRLTLTGFPSDNTSGTYYLGISALDSNYNEIDQIVLPISGSPLPNPIVAEVRLTAINNAVWYRPHLSKNAAANSRFEVRDFFIEDITEVDTKTSAEITNRNTAIANAMGAEVTRVSNLLTSYVSTTALGTALASYSTITDRDTSISNAMSAEAERVSDLLTSYVTGDSLLTQFQAEALTRNQAISTATGALALRQTSLEASASASFVTLNQNPKFAIWPDATPLPFGWSWWQEKGTAQRVTNPGSDGGYFLRRVSPVGFESGVYQSALSVQPGWYVLEADVELIEGTWAGSGVSVSGNFNLNFSTEADINGDISATVVKRRRFSKLVKVTSVSTNWHLMDNWTPFGNAYKFLEWHYCGLRAASDGEIIAQKVNNDLYKTGGVVARIVTLENVTTDGTFATATRVGTLEVKVGGVDGNGGMAGRISSLETVTTNGTFAAATRVNVLESGNSVSLNPNAYFRVTGYTTGVPSGWSPWFGAENISKSLQTGRNGTIPVKMVRSGGNDVGFAISVVSIPAGWYVLEAEVQLLGGTWSGSGMHVNFNNGTSQNIHFATQPDINDLISSSISVNRRSWSVLVKNPSQTNASFYAMGGWATFLGGYAGDNETHWHKCVIRPASDGEIKAQKAQNTLNDPGGVFARIATLENVTTDGTFAKASTLTTTLASYATNAGVSQAFVDLNTNVIAGLQEKTQASFVITADAGNGRAQLSIKADAYGNNGIDLTGDVRIHGSLTIDNSLGSTKFAPSSVAKVAFQTTTYDISIPHDGYANFPGDPGTGSVGSGGSGGTGGGSCPEINELILLANDDKTGPGQEIPAKDLKVGDYVWTQHEFTMEWGAYPISVVRFVECINVWEARGFKASFDHPTWVDDHWEAHCEQGTRVKGVFTVAFITVDDAHTYMCAGVLSHNKNNENQL